MHLGYPQQGWSVGVYLRATGIAIAFFVVKSLPSSIVRAARRRESDIHMFHRKASNGAEVNYPPRNNELNINNKTYRL